MTATGLAVARSLDRRGIPVYGVDAKRWEIGHHSAHVRRPPFAFEAHGPALAAAVAAWAEKQPAEPVLFPADDPSCAFLAAHYAELSRSCLLPAGYGSGVAPVLLDKRAFYRRCAELGVDLPRTIFPEDTPHLAERSGDLRYPVILKPAHGHLWRARFGGKKVLEVHSRDELLRTFDRLGEGSEMTVQEVIPGPEREILVCGAYFRADGAAQALLTARKTRQYPPRFGSGSLVESEWHEEIARLSVDLVRRLGYSGICGTEYKPDSRDGRFKLIEVNPRPTLWFSLCRAADCDVVYHAWCDLVGERLPEQVGRQRDGVRWQYFLRDVLSLTHYARRGETRAGDWAESLSPRRKDEAVASFADLRASLYYPLYGFRQWRAHRRGQDTGP
jgi:predicted ATP-grasp superfamily ATP-dependent carboligase